MLEIIKRDFDLVQTRIFYRVCEEHTPPHLQERMVADVNRLADLIQTIETYQGLAMVQISKVLKVIYQELAIFAAFRAVMALESTMRKW